MMHESFVIIFVAQYTSPKITAGVQQIIHQYFLHKKQTIIYFSYAFLITFLPIHSLPSST
jgi:hypothetical protein